MGNRTVGTLMATDINTTLQDLATTAKGLGDKSWIWQLIGGILLAASLWYTKWQLDKKTAELAAAEAALEIQRLEAQQALVLSAVAGKQKECDAAYAEAKKKLDEIHLGVLQMAAHTEANRSHLEQLDAIKSGDWDALNKMTRKP